MDSFILEDVNELLRLKKGDSSRLIHIKESSEANGIISLSDRKYVERLSSQYLRISEQKKPEKQNKSKFIPVEEKVDRSKKDENLTTHQTAQIEKPKYTESQIVSRYSTEKETVSGHKLKLNKNIIFSLGAIVLAIILIGVIAIGFDGIQLPVNVGIPQSDSLADFSLKTDKTSYETSDIVSISGKMSSTSSGTLELSIENEDGQLIWLENLNLKNNGEFSTLVIAGGQGWENGGKYFLNVEYNEFSNKISFDYTVK